jgi:hypothetical protein
VKEPPHDFGGGRLVATITDPDGNVLGLLQDRRGERLHAIVKASAPVLSLVV